MGNCCGICRKLKSSPVQRKIVLLLVGLDNSGKTTAAKGLSGDFVNSTVPTVGFSVVKLNHKGYDIIIYDLGGGPQIRAIWNSYFNDVHGVIFVVDASDRARLEESKNILERLLCDEKLAGKPVLVLANKQDKSNALDEIDIVEMLKLEPLVNQQKCPTLVEVCSALTNSTTKCRQVDKRLLRGYKWLVKQVITNYSTINNRVETDVKAEKERMQILRDKLRQKKDEEERDTVNSHEQTVPNFNAESPVANGEAPENFHSQIGNLSSGVAQQKAHFRSMLEQKGEVQNKLTTSNRNWKNNKVYPTQEQNFDVNPVLISSPTAPLFEYGSMTFRALTSPVRKANPQLTPMTLSLRPSTSKSLGNEGTTSSEFFEFPPKLTVNSLKKGSLPFGKDIKINSISGGELISVGVTAVQIVDSSNGRDDKCGAWGLEQELQIIVSHTQTSLINNQPDRTDVVEYFKH